MSSDPPVRERCYGCFRPRDSCFCHSIPRIDNQTAVLILQHRRERFHPFNTARIVQQALRNSLLLADHRDNLARRIQLLPGAGLLYPGPAARLISDVPPEQRPAQLVVLDGTWHQTKTLLREIPQLQSLPRFALSPAEPSRYRIRREPSATALSTVEATVAALRVLEPETAGLDRLLKAFDRMVEDQLTHPGSDRGQRFRERQARTIENVPLALVGSLENVVVAYGEAAAGKRGQRQNAGPPIVWVAQRLGSGEAFACTLVPPAPLNDVFLGHLKLTQADFAAALSLDEARRRWAEFQRPGDVVTVFHPGTARLFSHLAPNSADCLVLKSVAAELSDQRMLEAAADSPSTPGRAGRRLATTIALVRHLNAFTAAHLRQADPRRRIDSALAG